VEPPAQGAQAAALLSLSAARALTQLESGDLRGRAESMPQEKAQELLPHAMFVGLGSWLTDPSSGVYRATSLDRS
jgi:hypothetical protein